MLIKKRLIIIPRIFLQSKSILDPIFGHPQVTILLKYFLSPTMVTAFPMPFQDLKVSAPPLSNTFHRPCLSRSLKYTETGMMRLAGFICYVAVWILYLFNLAMFPLRVIATCSVKSCCVSERLFMAMSLSFSTVAAPAPKKRGGGIFFRGVQEIFKKFCLAVLCVHGVPKARMQWPEAVA